MCRVVGRTRHKRIPSQSVVDELPQSTCPLLCVAQYIVDFVVALSIQTVLRYLNAIRYNELPFQGFYEIIDENGSRSESI